MIDDCPGVRIFEEVEELLLDVAVVDVEGCTAGLVGPQHAFEVLVSVVEIKGHVILAGFPALKPTPLRAAPQAVGPQEIGQTARAIRDLGPSEPPIPKDDALALGDGLGNGFVDEG